MWFRGRRRRRSVFPCVFCSRAANPSGKVAVFDVDAVRRFGCRLPGAEPAVDQRWLAHLSCLHSAELEVGGGVDTTCVVCGKEVDAEEREPGADGGVRKLLGVRPDEPSPLDAVLTSFDAAMRAWQCRRCARWQCNRCVVAALADGGPPIADHAGCGGRFAPPA